MPKKTSLNPRKYASQHRSQATVDALVEATARILVKDGFDHASTNRIAEKAGVSIGSLYQYFPSKEALVAAVIERHKNQMMAVLRTVLSKVAERPIEEAARELVTVMIEAHRVDPALHRVLVEQIPRTGRLAEVEAFDRESYALVRGYLETRKGDLRSVSIDLAAFVCVTAVEALTHGAVVRSPEILANDHVDTFIDEVTRLVVQYLR